MFDPKPISLTQVDETDYTGPKPQPFVVVGDVPGNGSSEPADINALLRTIAGYSAGAVQTLTNDSGTFRWVTEESV